MALFKLVCWAIIFLTKLRFPPGCSIATTKLNLSGGTMTGNVNMQNHKLVNLQDPVDLKDSTHKKYVDDANNLKLSLSGGTMSGDLNMGNHHILHALNYVPSSNQHVVNKKYMKNWTLPNTMFDATLDDVSSISYIGNNKKVNSLVNLGRKQNWNLEQSDDNKKPLFVKSTVNNKFYCLQYSGSNYNNLNLSSPVNLLQSCINVFYRLCFEIKKCIRK